MWKATKAGRMVKGRRGGKEVKRGREKEIRMDCAVKTFLF